MMEAPITENATPFSQEALTELYENMDFSKRDKNLEIFLAQDDQLPINNPPYPSSIFPDRA